MSRVKEILSVLENQAHQANSLMGTNWDPDGGDATPAQQAAMDATRDLYLAVKAARGEIERAAEEESALTPEDRILRLREEAEYAYSQWPEYPGYEEKVEKLRRWCELLGLKWEGYKFIK